MIATEKEAYNLLNLLNINYNPVHHPPITSVVDIPYKLPGPQVKNLILTSKKSKKIYFLIVPDEKKVDFKNLSNLLGERRLSFLPESSLLEVLNVLPGTVSPFTLINDCEHRITILIDKDIDTDDTIGFHPNINTTTVIMEFKDFEKILQHFNYTPIFISI